MQNKMNVIVNRLIELGKTRVELANYLEVYPATITKIINKEREIKSTELVKLANFLKYNVESFANYITGIKDELPVPVQTSHSDDILIPYYNVTPSAGGGIFVNNEYINSFMKISKGQLASNIPDVKNCAILAISGNSMEPTLHDRDFVIINTNDCRIIDGKIYVIRVKDEDTLYIKRLFRNPVTKEITIRSDNNQYQEWKTNEEDIKICGRLICKVFEEI